MMKQVIVLHSRDLIGGACESVKLLIENIGHPVDIIIPKGQADYITKKEIRKFYGSNVKDIFEFFLPYSYEEIEGVEQFDLSKIHRSLRLFERHKKELYAFLAEKEYEHIHLNSFGLYPMLSKKFPMTLHVREKMKDNMKSKLKIYKYLHQAKGFVFVDETTRKPFKRLRNSGVVLPNPVDQRMLNQLSGNRIMDRLGISKKDVVFTIAGSITEFKGQEFLIRVFNKFNSYPYKLLVIGGNGAADVKKECVGLAENNPNIFFLGQLNKKEMLEVYRITDYVVRAEKFFVIGRTVYEGLYSGCGLIIQGDCEDMAQIEDYEKIKDRVYHYLPRDEESLLRVLEQMGGKKIEVHKGEANAENYSRLFNQWIDSVLN